MPNILVDAGPLIALFRRRERDHLRIRRFVEQARTRFVTTMPVVTEAAHFLNPAAKAALYTWIQRGGLTLASPVAEDFGALVTISERYSERDIDLADASLIWLADRLNCTQILTLDRRDFTVYRLSNGKSFRLVADSGS